ncbi:hypothetical protein J6590_099726 [Homalodisca vitripennis]|nr:hypothetical protein J6590_099726 [Homalodisca vitripennis]
MRGSNVAQHSQCVNARFVKKAKLVPFRVFVPETRRLSRAISVLHLSIRLGNVETLPAGLLSETVLDFAVETEL